MLGEVKPPSGTLTFDPGETNQTFGVPILDDVVVESDETVGLALSNPNNAAPGVPITRADTGGPYLVAMGTGRAAAAVGVTLSTTDVTDDILAFNVQGGLEDFTTQPTITLALNGQWIDLAIAPSTGTITETTGP